MKTKLIFASIAILTSMSVWADDVWNYNVYGDCNKNGYIGIENGYQWVDLGLPSGIKWASCNVGAENPEDYGNYYAWGETAPKTDYSWETYKYTSGASYKLTKYCNDASYGNEGFTDNKTTLDPEDDAATVNWGGTWRMPTDAEWTELRRQCTWTWTTQSGVNGYLVASKTNSNSIFLPAAGYRYDPTLSYAGSRGYYWSSSLNDSGPYAARGTSTSIRTTCTGAATIASAVSLSVLFARSLRTLSYGQRTHYIRPESPAGARLRSRLTGATGGDSGTTTETF